MLKKSRNNLKRRKAKNHGRSQRASLLVVMKNLKNKCHKVNVREILAALRINSYFPKLILLLISQRDYFLKLNPKISI